MHSYTKIISHCKIVRPSVIYFVIIVVFSSFVLIQLSGVGLYQYQDVIEGGHENQLSNNNINKIIGAMKYNSHLCELDR